ncbi:hypothetical protein CYMTET_22643 [Cymbomonas tetramitiformis]|uniref:Uncharacterized protein n=1 Tax=Cymbomonas tetramitiformis TaxID=36881 RepID=A0AAE0L1R6_9CHLO|nr:hypothetical protein CYMTET_22643 [Cymbomonas tetramitiformis]
MRGEDGEPTEMFSEQNLTLRFPPQHCNYKFNGKKVAKDEQVVMQLRRDRPGCYLTMDSFVLEDGELRMELFVDNERQLHAVLNFELPHTTSEGGNESMTRMGIKCFAAVLPDNSFSKGITAELNVVGCTGQMHHCLNSSAHLCVRRQRLSQNLSKKLTALEAITEKDHEEKEEEAPSKSAPLFDPSKFDAALFEKTFARLGGQGLEEDGQITWFNAGVRLGMGATLGLVMGLGLGGGILVKSLQTGTGTVANKIHEVKSKLTTRSLW